jgi:hypothetical protein
MKAAGVEGRILRMGGRNARTVRSLSFHSSCTEPRRRTSIRLRSGKSLGESLDMLPAGALTNISMRMSKRSVNQPH